MKSVREIEVRYSETDQMGVVYHANYLVWMEVGRTSFLSDVGFSMSEIEREGYMFPVYAMDIKFLNATRYDEKVIVETEIYKTSKIKTIYKQKVLNDKGQEKVSAFVTIVCVDKKNFKPVRIDKQLPKLYETYSSLSCEK